MIAATEKEDSLAQQYLERVTQLAEWNGDAWWYLGTSYLEKGDYQKLLETMDQAKKVVPRDFRVYLLMGVAYSRLNQADQAITVLRRALELKPDDVNTLSTLALTLDGLHRFAESDSLYEAALKIDPKYHLVLNNYGYSLAERGLQLERALAMALQAIAAEPNNAAYLDTVGWIYFKMGKFEEAERFIAKAIAAGGASATVYEHMGDIYFKLGQKDMAGQYWKQALNMNAANQALREKLARGSL
jgi:Tfp pilus assembly protein PilF